MTTATSNRPAIEVGVLLAIILASFWVARYFPNLVLMLIVSTLTAFILQPIVKVFELRFGLRGSISIALVFPGVAGMHPAIPLTMILKASSVETYWGLKNYQITA
jgi:predicted PurR-regulated permease PerM